MDMEEKALPPPLPSSFIPSSPWVWSRRDGPGLLGSETAGCGSPPLPRPGPSGITLPHTPMPSLPLRAGLLPVGAHSHPLLLLRLPLHSWFVLSVCWCPVCLYAFFFPLGFPWQPFPVSWPWEENWSLGPPLRCGPHLTLASRGYFYPE